MSLSAGARCLRCNKEEAMKPKVLLDKLKETVSPKAIKTLDAIYEICLEQEKEVCMISLWLPLLV